MSNSIRGICELCRQAAGTDFCNDCDQLFCQTCKILHVRSKSNRFHTFRNNDFAKKEASRPICDQHKEEYSYFCEVCDEPTCKACIFTSHKGHNMANIENTVAKKKKEMSSTWDLYGRKLETSRQNVDKMEESLQLYRQKIYKTIEDIQREGERLKSDIDNSVATMVKELRGREMEELQRISRVMNYMKTQLKNGSQLEQHISKTMKMKNDTSLLLSLQKFQKDMESYEPQVIQPSDFSYLKGNSGFSNVQTLLGRLFFEKEKSESGTPSEESARSERDWRSERKFDIWVCQMCNTERYIGIEQTEDRSYKTPRCCYGFMIRKGNVYK